MISWIALLQAAGYLFGEVNAWFSGIQPEEFFQGYQVLTDRFLPAGPKFYFYSKEYPNGVIFHVQKPQVSLKKEANTKIITHGYKGNKEQVQVIVNEYLKQENLNVVVFDWEFLADFFEPQAAVSVFSLGHVFVGYLISKMIWDYDVKPEQIHLIGFDMGAHLMGAAARTQSKKIGRITGLDPRRRFYEGLVGLPRLTPDDARFVDVYHTNGEGTGFAKPIGTADFFPNGGKSQPKCKGDNSGLCNSLVANEYFAESINQKESFWGVQCPDYARFMDKLCKDNPITIAGEFGNTTARGTYFYRTNSASPYGLGSPGTAPEN